MQKVAFIGLGIMGNPMALNLQKKSYQLSLWNRSKEKAGNLLKGGAQWAESPEKAVKENGIVITMLSTPEAVEEVALGEKGFLKGMKNGSIWLNCSTVNPSFAKKMNTRAKEKGIIYLDGPVAGTKGPAEMGELVFLLGGEANSIEKIHPLLDAMGKKNIRLGPVGNGSNMKMLINLLLAQSMLAFSEALMLGREMGLDKELLFNVLLNTPVTAPFLERVRPKIEAGNFAPNFPLQWMHKDIHLATLTAYEHGVAMPSLNTAKEIFALAKQNNYGEKDFSAIYDYLQINNNK